MNEVLEAATARSVAVPIRGSYAAPAVAAIRPPKPDVGRRRGEKDLADLSATFNPVLRGWHQYYGRFYKSAMSAVWRHLNDYLTRWMMRKYKRLARHKTRAGHALGRLAQKFPSAFVHWQLGCLPKAG